MNPISSVVEKSIGSEKPSVVVSVSGLEKCFFYYGQGMQNQWAEGNAIFEKCAGSKRGQSVKVSFLAGELAVSEIGESLLPKFKTAEEKQTHLDSLYFWEQELHQDKKEDFPNLAE